MPNTTLVVAVAIHVIPLEASNVDFTQADIAYYGRALGVGKAKLALTGRLDRVRSVSPFGLQYPLAMTFSIQTGLEWANRR